MNNLHNFNQLMSRQGQYASGFLNSIDLPTPCDRLPRKKLRTCEYVLLDSHLFPYLEVFSDLVFPYRGRTYWSFWVTFIDLTGDQDFIHRRFKAFPTGWVEAKEGDDPKEIAKFLFINSLSQYSQSDPGEQAENVIEMAYFRPDFLSTHEIIAGFLSIFTEIDSLEKIHIENEKAAVLSAFPEYRELVSERLDNITTIKTS